jgi:hypothetical protein
MQLLTFFTIAIKAINALIRTNINFLMWFFLERKSVFKDETLAEFHST